MQRCRTSLRLIWYLNGGARSILVTGENASTGDSIREQRCLAQEVFEKIILKIE